MPRILPTQYLRLPRGKNDESSASWLVCTRFRRHNEGSSLRASKGFDRDWRSIGSDDTTDRHEETGRESQLEDVVRQR